MRRYAQVTLTLAAFCAVLWPGVARASLGTELFARCFGEQTDAAHQAFSTDFAAESPLRQYAFQVVIAPSAPQAPLAFRSVSLPKLADTVFEKVTFASLAPAAVVPADVAIAAPQAPTVEYYTEPAPLPTDPPAFYRFDLDGASGGFSERLAVPGRVGRVHFQTHAEAAQAPSSFASVAQTSIGAGATLNARVGSRTVGVDVSSELAHYTNADPNSASGLSNDMVPVFIPAYADVSKRSVSAGIAVPVSRRVTANLAVDSQHLFGDTVPLDAYNTVFGAGLTYKMKGSGFLSLSAKQYRYQNNLLPSNALTQSSASLTFTVKF